METKSLWSGAAAIAGLGALVFTVGCGGTQNAAGVRAQELTAGQAGAPVVVSCEPHQRTLVRQAIVNGAAVSQVQCVAADGQQALTAAQAQYAQPAAYAQPAYAQPVAYGRAPVVERPVYSDVSDARIVRTSAPARVVRPVQTRQVVIEEPVKKTRSVKKSAVIIGSSAGVGAGVGAAVGGKKGALIGAAIGGGGAAVWDQITRR
jgi:hypothetical protein